MKVTKEREYERKCVCVCVFIALFFVPMCRPYLFILFILFLVTELISCLTLNFFIFPYSSAFSSQRAKPHAI